MTLKSVRSRMTVPIDLLDQYLKRVSDKRTKTIDSAIDSCRRSLIKLMLLLEISAGLFPSTFIP